MPPRRRRVLRIPHTPRPESFGLLWRRLLFGPPIPTRKAHESLLPRSLALPIFSSDAISSVAYATQEILLALGLAGMTAAAQRGTYSAYLWGVTIAICLLLAIVVASYRQTISAYPSGGGSYIVSKENLGTGASLIAAAALLIDYILTVSVSIAAGVQNLLATPAVGALGAHPVVVCVALVAVLTLANLRGLRQSGSLFAAPTYLFILLAYLTIGLGLIGPLFGWHLQREEVNQAYPPNHAALAGSLGLFIALRAFANGCSAMTGTEAISNGIPAFREPQTRNAAATLTLMGVILATLFLGMSGLAAELHVVYWENGHETAPAVIDQISGAVFGRTGSWAWLYYGMQFATAGILILAANTSFADFPRLASILAVDRFLPRQLAIRGDRLVFSNGICLLGLAAAILLVVFHGSVDRLIPLYALGVFTAFTLSQAGMVRHWLRLRGPGWRDKAAVNGLGAVATAIVFLVILIEKAPEGAWVVVVLAVLLILVFRGIRKHYDWMLDQLRQSEAVVDIDEPGRNVVIVLVSNPTRAVVPALHYARMLQPNFRAVYVAVEPERAERVQADWADIFPKIPLVTLASPYRSLIEPLLDYIDFTRERNPGALITVVLPEYFTCHWWDVFLVNGSGRMIKSALAGREDVVMINIRWRLPDREPPAG